MFSSIDHNTLHKLNIVADLTVSSFYNAVDIYYGLVAERKDIPNSMKEHYYKGFKLYVSLNNIGDALASLPVNMYKKIAIDPTLKNDDWYIVYPFDNTKPYNEIYPIIGVYSKGV